jgi:hypothetical protein
MAILFDSQDAALFGESELSLDRARERITKNLIELGLL